MTIGNWIAVGALILSALSFTVGRTKDRDTAKENYIKMNMKLDQLCSNTNQILIKIEQHDAKITSLEKDFAVLKASFNQLKGELK